MADSYRGANDMRSVAQKPYGVVYLIQNMVTGTAYIGLATDVTVRWTQHRSELRNDTHGNPRLRRAWKKYGEDAFEFDILETATNESDLCETERFYIEYFRFCGADLYNIREGGYSGRWIGPRPPVSEATRQKRSATMKARGLGFSPEATAKRAAMGRGKPLTAEHRRKVSEAGKGRTPSKETREKISRATTGVKKTYTPETYARMLASRTGKHHTEEHKQKIGKGGERRNPIILFVGPNGKVHKTRNVGAFARKHKLAVRQMGHISEGTAIQHRGWKLLAKQLVLKF
jgi:group I intron endonuclease